MAYIHDVLQNQLCLTAWKADKLFTGPEQRHMLYLTYKLKQN